MLAIDHALGTGRRAVQHDHSVADTGEHLESLVRRRFWMAHGDAGLEMVGLPAAGGIAEADARDDSALTGSLQEPAIGRDHAVGLRRLDHAREPRADQAPIVQDDVSSHGCDRTG